MKGAKIENTGKQKNDNKKKRVENVRLTVKLAVSYSVLVFCILVVGLLSYEVASDAIIESYQSSSIQSLDMIGEYIEYGFENVSAQAVTYLVDEELGLYLSGKLSQGEQLSYYNKQKTALLNKVSADTFISGLYFLSDDAPSLSAGSKSLDHTYTAVMETSQKEAAASDSQSDFWIGEMREIDELLGIDSDSYAVRVLKQFYKKNAVLMIDIDKQAITDILNGIDPGEGSCVVFVTGDGRELYQDGSRSADLGQTSFYQTAVQSGETLGCIENVEFQGNKSLFLYRKIGDTGSMVCVLLPNTLLTSQVSGIRYVAAGVLILSCLLALVIAVGISAGINRTVKYMIQNMRSIAAGNMDVRMCITGKSEFAQMAAQMNVMLDSVSVLLENIKKVSKKVADSANDVYDSSFSIKDSTLHISQVMNSLEDGMSSQSKDTVSCCVQLDGLAERIGEVADRSEDIRMITKNTETYIENSKDALDSLRVKTGETSQTTYSIIESIEALRVKTEKIDKIINTVLEIADETALLSLNASIESARAGEQGRGFQVIAGEIRKLADQSMVATREIGNIVEDISQTTLQVVETAGQAEQIIGRQNEAVDSVLDAFANMIMELKQLMNSVSSITQGAVNMGSRKEEAVRNMETIASVTQATVESVVTVKERTMHQEVEVDKLTILSQEMQKQVSELEESLQKFRLL